MIGINPVPSDHRLAPSVAGARHRHTLDLDIAGVLNRHQPTAVDARE